MKFRFSSAVGERNTKIAVVLIQRNTFNVDVITEENLYTEKASELCSTCDINPKMLLLLQTQVEHLQGFIIRLITCYQMYRPWNVKMRSNSVYILQA